MSDILEPFMWRALVGGIGIALVTGPLGCFIVWRRMAYFGDALAHSALLGIVLGIAIGLNLNLGILIIGVLFATLLLFLQKQQRHSTDTLLGILSHSALALGIIGFSFLSTARIDLYNYLFGDILGVNLQDIVWIYGGVIITFLTLAMTWRSLLLTALNSDLAQAEGISTLWVNLLLLSLIAIVVAIAMQIIGVLLITALLIIPAAAARGWVNSPLRMIIFSSLIGVFSVLLGLLSSLWIDIPSGPSIIVAALAFFILSLLFAKQC